MIKNITVSNNCAANKSVKVSWRTNQTFPDGVRSLIYIQNNATDTTMELPKVSNAAIVSLVVQNTAELNFLTMLLFCH